MMGEVRQGISHLETLTCPVFDIKPAFIDLIVAIGVRAVPGGWCANLYSAREARFPPSRAD